MSDIFLVIRLEFRLEDHSGKVTLSSHYIKCTCYQLSQLMLTLHYLGEAVFDSFLYFLHLSILCSIQPTLEEWGLMLHLLEDRVENMNYLELFYIGDLSLLPLAFIYIIVDFVDIFK